MPLALQQPDCDDSEDLLLTEMDASAAAGDGAEVSEFAQSLAQTYADRVPPEREGSLHWV